MKIQSIPRAPRAQRPPFPVIRWIVAAALITVTSVACDVHSPVGPGEVASLTLTPAETTLEINSTQQLVARAFDADGREISITGPGAESSAQWEMVNGGGTVDDAGLFHAGTQLGTFNNTVRVEIGGQEAFASFTVTVGPAVAISIHPDPDTLEIGATRQFTASGEDAGGNPVPVTPTWSVVNGGGEMDSSSGLFTAGTTAGTFDNTVRASSGSLSGLASVTITPGPAVSLVVTPDPHAMSVNGVQQFTATATDASGNTSPVTPTWSVVNGGGTINSTTGVFAAGSNPGTFENTVRATSGDLSGSATVTVMAGPAVSITVRPNPATVNTGGTQQFNATAVDASGNPVPISPVWSVQNGGGSINASTGMFTAGSETGTFNNTVRATNGSLSGSATVTVSDAPQALSITVTPNPATVGTEETQQFTATATDSSGDPVSITPVWSVVNGGGTINSSTGVFTAGTETGTFTNTVRATSGSLSGSATVTVRDAPQDLSITVTPNPASVGTGQTQQFTATAMDSSGDPVAISPVWSVENGGGTISGTGLFTAGAETGTFTNTVRATSGTAFGAATVNVTEVPQEPVPDGIFGSAAPNGIMAGTEVTCVDLGLISADVSISPGNTVTGFPPCEISGVQNLNNDLAVQMQTDLTTAYNTLAGLPCPPANAIAADLGGTTMPAGVYCTASGIGVTGTLTLDGGGDPNAEFVFQAGTSLTTAGDIVLIGGAQAQNVYWQVGSSATIGTASQWQGNIVALSSITLVDTATLLGRALARNGAVTLGTGNTITLP